jgi:hypothetical protein
MAYGQLRKEMKHDLDVVAGATATTILDWDKRENKTRYC